MLHADICADLLRTIFAPRTPLHDGAVIIRDEMILAAGALLPLAEMTVHTERFGTRHRAALGITEQTDAVVIVVSEENGQVSLVERARIVRNLNEPQLARAIRAPARRRPTAAAGRAGAVLADGATRPAAGAPRLSDLGRSVVAAEPAAERARRRDARHAARRRPGRRTQAAAVSRLLGALVLQLAPQARRVALATLLYAGLVVSQNAQTRPVSVPIEAVEPAGGHDPVGSLGEVTDIRYFVTDQPMSRHVRQLQRPGRPVESIRRPARRQSSGSSSSRPIRGSRSSTHARRRRRVRLEKVEPKDVTVVVIPGAVPDGLEDRPPQQSIQTATVRGAESDIARVTQVRAQSSDRLVAASTSTATSTLIAGRRARRARPRRRRRAIDGARHHGRLQIGRPRPFRSSPIVGELGAGFEVVRVSVSAPVVSLEGDASDLADLDRGRHPADLDRGRDLGPDTTVGFDLPTG